MPELEVINNAWNIGQTIGITPHQIDGTDMYIIPYPSAGWVGGYQGQGRNMNMVTIITIHGTNQTITGFPGNGLPLPSP
jgi:filamentous hemagglutinin